MTISARWSTTRQPEVAAADAIKLYEHDFGAEPSGVWAAPGRVNLIGEHVDYAGGVCLPFALTQCTYVAASPREDRSVHVVSQFTDENGAEVTHRAEIDLADVRPGHPSSWLGYVVGTLWCAIDEGVLPENTPGFNLAFVSDVPLGAGLSSSAAIECATAVAVAELSGLTIDTALLDRLVQCCMRAENEVVGASTGGLDQKTSLFGKPETALSLDFRFNTMEDIPCDFAKHGLAILVMNTNAPHLLADGQYASRRRVIDGVAETAGVPTLRDVEDSRFALEMWAKENQPDDVSRDEWLNEVHRRVRHVLTEIDRTLEAIEYLKADDFTAFAAKMRESHESLRDDYEVSCAELDLAVDTAVAEGAFGSRMTGGGFGGSAIALVDAAHAERIADAVAVAFADAGFRAPEFLVAVPSVGAFRVV